MTSKVQNRLVEKFISEVGSYLQDLGPDLRDDILREVRENLEARAEDNQTELTFPDSLQYANELRQAAGLEPVAIQKGLFRNFLLQIQMRLRTNRFALQVAKVLAPLKPMFWLAIAISSFGFIQLYVLGDSPYIGVPSNLEQWLLWLIIMAAALWFGAAKFGPVWKRIRTIGIVITFIPMSIMFQGIAEGVVSTVDELVNGNPALRTTGLIYNGFPVTNIFPYDADGNLLENVRLVDDMGRPLNSSAEKLLTPVEVLLLDGTVRDGYLSPATDSLGAEVWNVYPLKGSLEPESLGRFPVVVQNPQD
ncbi:MAG: hypothetical protein RIR89_402 [Actinomycetota bacterium]|jgi:hypothetical protein